MRLELVPEDNIPVCLIFYPLPFDFAACQNLSHPMQIIQSLQTFLVSADRNSSGTGTRTTSGTGNARWSKLRTPWENKTALALLLGEAVKAKVIG